MWMTMQLIARARRSHSGEQYSWQHTTCSTVLWDKGNIVEEWNSGDDSTQHSEQKQGVEGVMVKYGKSADDDSQPEVQCWRSRSHSAAVEEYT